MIFPQKPSPEIGNVTFEINHDFHLRRLRHDDKCSLKQSLENPRVLEFTAFGDVLSDKTVNQIICRSIASSSVDLAIVEKRTDKVVGMIGISEAQREIGYWLSEAFHGKGIMSLAIEIYLSEIVKRRLKLKSICASVRADNEASKRVLEKNGFELNATVKNGIWRNKPFDKLIFAKTI